MPRQLLGAPSTRPGITGVPYDTAWLAGLSTDSDRRISRFPTTLRWLADNQLSDGSWGSSVRYEHDRILCTLASLAPLAEFGRRAEDLKAPGKAEVALFDELRPPPAIALPAPVPHRGLCLQLGELSSKD